MTESSYFSKEVGEGFSEYFSGTTLNLAANLVESAYFSKEVGEGFSGEFGGKTLNLAMYLADSQLSKNGQLPKNGR